MNKYEVLGIVGEGAYGVVQKCKHKESGEIVAIKKFKESDNDEVIRKTSLREVKILKLLKHDHIVQQKEAFRRKEKLYLVFEYMDKSLLELIEEFPNGINQDKIRLYVYQQIKATLYLHKTEIIHRDIKPENLLVNNDDTLKLCDFGFARTYPNPGAPLTEYVATRWYRSPELLLTSCYAYPVDIWAIGCIMAEMIDGNALFPGDDLLDQINVIMKVCGGLTDGLMYLKSKNPDLANIQFNITQPLETLDKKYGRKIDAKAMDQLKKLQIMDPNRRISAENALEHPYFDCLRPKSISRITSPVFEKHRAMSSTQRHGAQYTNYSLKENFNPHTTQGKFRNNESYTSMIRSSSKGKKKLEEAKYHSRNQPNQPQYVTTSTNHLATTNSNYNSNHKRKPSHGKAISKKVFKNENYSTAPTQIYSNVNPTGKSFAINTTSQFYNRKRNEERNEDETHVRNSSVKRDASKSRNNKSRVQMFQINEETEFMKSSPIKHYVNQPDSYNSGAYKPQNQNLNITPNNDRNVNMNASNFSNYSRAKIVNQNEDENFGQNVGQVTIHLPSLGYKQEGSQYVTNANQTYVSKPKYSRSSFLGHK